MNTVKKVLHTVNKSAAQSAVLEDCLALLGPDDALLLLEDAVLAAMDIELNQELFSNLDTPLYALQEDVNARGLDGRLMSRVTLADYAMFIQLCVSYPRIINWT